MKEQKNDFSKAEIRQELWSLRYGIVKVAHIDKLDCEIKCVDEDSNAHLWNFDGHNDHNYGYQDLYWRRPTVEFIPDPVRKVKKEVDVRVHVWHEGHFSIFKNTLDGKLNLKEGNYEGKLILEVEE